MRTSTTSRRVLGGLVAASAVAGIGLALPADAVAANLPADPAAHGYLGLCGPDGRQVTSGYLDVAPFVWKAVSSVPAPAAYTGRGQNADLVIVQPRTGVPAAYWSGDTLTAASFYSTTAHPTVQATAADIPLATIVREFPPADGGLYEVRMDVARTNYGDYSTTYPTAMIKVTGTRWTEVSHGRVDCGSGRGVSQETLVGTASKQQSSPAFAQRQAARQAAASQHGRSSGHGPAATSGTGSSAATGATAPAGASGHPARTGFRDAASTGSTGHGLSAGDDALIALGAVALLGLGTGGALRLRRRAKS